VSAEELRIEGDGFTLAATYSPAGDIAVVGLHGAGEGTRDSPSLRYLHELLPQHAIGVVTFDRRGEGESTGDATRGRFDLQADDALTVLHAIDAERVGLFGYSQGGWIAPIAAAQSDDVAFLVLVASIGVTPSEQMMVAVERQLRLAGYGDDVVDRALDLRRRFEHWIHAVAHEPDEQLAGDLLAAVDEPWAGQLWLPPSLLDEEGVRLWLEEMDYDPRPTFAQVRVPTLSFYGELDSWAPVEASVRAWRDALGDGVELVVIPGAEHDLTLPDGTFAPEYDRRLVDWLLALR
jgi:pimeloyl-ACP methyl ester carboxylesterase